MDYDSEEYYESDSAYDEDIDELITSDDDSLGGTAHYDAPGSSAAKVCSAWCGVCCLRNELVVTRQVHACP